MADIGKVWSFTQLGPPGDSMVLTGWSAPFGRPRNGTLVNAGTAIRTAATYYSGNIPPTVHAFGRARPPWELSGRFMDQATSVGYTQALQKQWNDFVEAQQIVRAQWGEILSYQIFIDKMDLNYESEHEIAWAMKGAVILDEASTATPDVQPAQAPANTASVMSSLFAPVDAWHQPSFGNILSLLPELSDDIDNILGQIRTPIGEVYNLCQSVSDFESASTATLGKISAGLSALETGLTDLQLSTDTLVAAAESFNAPSAYWPSGVLSGAQMVALTTQKTLTDANTVALLAVIAALQDAADEATVGQVQKLYQAQAGDTWESAAGRLMGGADGGRSMRLINGARYGQLPQPGNRYLVPTRS